AEGNGALQSACPGSAERHLGYEGHAPLRRGAARRGQTAPGRRLLVLRARAEPQDPRDVPASPLLAGSVGPRAEAGGALPSGDTRNLLDLTATNRSHFCSLPLSPP